MTTAAPQAFARQATGIVRQGRTRDAFFYNVMWCGTALTFTFFWLLLPFYYTGSNAIVSMLIAGAIGMPGAILYAMLSQMMPRTGGDYVFNSRGLHPLLGFIGNFNYCFWLIAIFGLYTTLISAYGITPFCRMIAGFTGNTSWLSHGDWFSTEWGLFITGSALVVLSAILFIMGGTRLFFRVQAVFFALYMLSIVIVLVTGLVEGHSGFASNFDHYAANLGTSDATAKLAHSAAQNGFATTGAFSLGASALAISVWWFIFGFTYATNYHAGEIRTGRRTHMISMPGAAAFVILVLILMSIAYTHFASYAFNYRLGFADPAAYGFSTGAPAYPEISAIASGNAFWGSLIIIGFVGGLLIWLPQTILLITRSVFAWSFDQLMPHRLADLTEKTQAPLTATLLIAALAIGSTAVYAFTTWFSQLSVLLGITVTLIITAITGIVIPYRQRELFDASPVNWRVGGVPVMSLVGACSLACFLGVEYVLLRDPGSGTSWAHNPGKSYLAVAVVVGAAAIYEVARRVRRRQGIDLRRAYMEIPPE
jgi:basic amino acid/polyamine antiporter, APA family